MSIRRSDALKWFLDELTERLHSCDLDKDQEKHENAQRKNKAEKAQLQKLFDAEIHNKLNVLLTDAVDKTVKLRKLLNKEIGVYIDEDLYVTIDYKCTITPRVLRIDEVK